MAAKLKNIIPAQSFELIPAQVALILSEEYAEQKRLRDLDPGHAGNDSFKEPTIWAYRYTAFAQEELPGIIITLDDGLYSNRDVRRADGEYKYLIDHYCQGSGKEVGGAIVDGYFVASVQLGQMVGNTRAILMNPLYDTLDLPTSKVMGRRIDNFYICEKEVNVRNKGILLNDLESNCIARMSLIVRATEYAELQTGVLFGESGNKIILQEVPEKGIMFKYITP